MSSVRHAAALFPLRFAAGQLCIGVCAASLSPRVVIVVTEAAVVAVYDTYMYVEYYLVHHKEVGIVQ